MGKQVKKGFNFATLGLFEKPETPKMSAKEKNLQRLQEDELKSQRSEIARRRGLLGRSSRRSLLTGSERGV